MKNISYKLIGLCITIAIVAWTSATPALAINDAFDFDKGIEIAKGVDDTLGGVGTPIDIVTNIINLFLSMSAVLALLALVWGSISYIISFGEEEKVKKAKRVILYAIFGLLFVGAAFLIITLIKNVITGGGGAAPPVV